MARRWGEGRLVRLGGLLGVGHRVVELGPPLARSRVRRLPADFPSVPGATFTAADRAAAVSEFLASPQAAKAGDADVARFWAEVLTGRGGYILGAPLWQVGPSKLAGHPAGPLLTIGSVMFMET